MAEYWGWCASCERSFYVCPVDGDTEPVSPACPVCMTPPAEIQITTLQE